MKAYKILSIAVLVLAVFVAVGLFTFAGPCVHEDGSFGGCLQSAMGIMGACLFLACIALVQLAVGNGTVRGILAIIAACLGLFMAFAPGNLLTLCMMDTMQCRLAMQPLAMFCGVLIALLSAGMAVLAFRSR